MRKSILLAIALPLAFPSLPTSCVHTQVTRVSEAKYPSTKQVELTPGDVDYPYEELAVIEARPRLLDNDFDVFKAMTRKAKKLGATAIIHLETYTKPTVLDTGFVTRTRMMRGVAIRRIEPAERKAAAPDTQAAHPVSVTSPAVFIVTGALPPE